MTYPQQTWALIKDGVIVNTVLCDDDSPNLFGDAGWDHIIDITDVHPLDDPGINYTWNEDEGFRPPKPDEHPSFVYDEDTKQWTPPVAKPDDVEDKEWLWDESSTSWVQHDLPEE